uniref:Elongation of very long chain fatty acids protein n=1 Tax=Oncorhynchus tshawytscha TaxID=74940 RepID=A0AAZ3R7M3_ONCTS
MATTWQKIQLFYQWFQPQPVLIVYNFAMVCMSACMFYEFTASSWLANYSLLCQPVDYSTSSMAKVCWWFYSSKVIELSDIKNCHLTFLHVYRHGTIIFNWWAGVKYVAGVRFLIGLINSLVHVYLYYWLAALGPHMQRYLWWKRYLTFLQLVSRVALMQSLCYSIAASQMAPCNLF